LDESREVFSKGMKCLFTFIATVKLEWSGKLGGLLKKIQNILVRSTSVELEKTLDSRNFLF